MQILNTGVTGLGIPTSDLVVGSMFEYGDGLYSMELVSKITLF